MKHTRSLKVLAASFAAVGTLGVTAVAAGLGSSSPETDVPVLPQGVTSASAGDVVTFGGGGGCQYCHDRFPRPVPETPRTPPTTAPRDEGGADTDTDTDSDTDTDTDRDVDTDLGFGR